MFGAHSVTPPETCVSTHLTLASGTAGTSLALFCVDYSKKGARVWESDVESRSAASLPTASMSRGGERERLNAGQRRGAVEAEYCRVESGRIHPIIKAD